MDQVISRDPEDEFKSPDEKGTAAAITITAQTSSNRSIVIQTYMDRDAPLTEFHRVVDKMSSTIDRQEAKSQLVDEQTNLALEEKTLKQLEEDYAAMPARAEAAWIASRKKGPYQPSAAELAQKGQVETNIKRYREAIAKRKADIAKYEGVVSRRD